MFVSARDEYKDILFFFSFNFNIQLLFFNIKKLSTVDVACILLLYILVLFYTTHKLDTYSTRNQPIIIKESDPYN
jgi:hypothetical protein